MSEVSLSVKALGKRYDAALLSIGAVVFDVQSGGTGKTFYREITLESSTHTGKVYGESIRWWMDKQRSEAARVLFAGDDSANPRKFHLATALQEFCTWFRSAGNGPCKVYGGHGTRDIPMIEFSIRTGTVGLEAPWHYTNVRDAETLISSAVDLVGFDRFALKYEGVRHNALDDAIYQAHLASAAWRALAGKQPTKASVKPVTKPVEQAEDW